MEDIIVSASSGDGALANLFQSQLLVNTLLDAVLTSWDL